jgi:ribosome-associated protein
LARKIAGILEEKKGEDILVLDIRGFADFTDCFVICSGTSDRMLQALSDEVIDQVRNDFHLKGRVEGVPHEGWILVDYGDVILHLFSPDRRDYYRLEELWGKGKILLRLQ